MSFLRVTSIRGPNGNESKSINKYPRHLCSLCKKSGHTIDNCPEISCSYCVEKKKKNFKGHSFKVCRYTKNRICFLCKKNGHRTIDCPHICIRCSQNETGILAKKEYRLFEGDNFLDTEEDLIDMIWSYSHALHLASACPRSEVFCPSTCEGERKSIEVKTIETKLPVIGTTRMDVKKSIEIGVRHRRTDSKFAIEAATTLLGCRK